MTWTEAPLHSLGETWEMLDEDELESPFTPAVSSLSETPTSSSLTGPGDSLVGTTSPFADASAGPDGALRGREAAVAELLAELFDPEMEHALGELVQESSAIHAEQLSLTSGEAPSSSGYAQEAVAQYLEPVAVRFAGR